jgi:hypothetical protein
LEQPLLADNISRQIPAAKTVLPEGVFIRIANANSDGGGNSHKVKKQKYDFNDIYTVLCAMRPKFFEFFLENY